MRELKLGLAALSLFLVGALGAGAAVGFAGSWSIALLRTAGHLTLTIRSDDGQGGFNKESSFDLNPTALTVTVSRAAGSLACSRVAPGSRREPLSVMRPRRNPIAGLATAGRRRDG